MDGVLNNDGIKHNCNEEQNATWSKLLRELRVYECMSDFEHIQYLRQRFVAGASSWLAGENGSSDNDKEVFGYKMSNGGLFGLLWLKMEHGLYQIFMINKEMF